MKIQNKARWYRRRTWVVALGVMGEIPLIVFAQQGSAKTASAVSNSLDATTRAKLEPILARAKDRGLPVNALTTKAAEGVLRGMPSARIVAAVEALEERLTTAHVALAPAQPEDIEAGALALSVGVKVDVLRNIRRYQPKTSVAVPLGVLAQLISQGVSQNRATEIVYQLLARGATPQQLLALRNAVHGDILAGAPASHALDTRAATVLSALGRSPTIEGAILPAGASDSYKANTGGKKR